MHIDQRLPLLAELVAGYVPRHVSAAEWSACRDGVRSAASTSASTLPTVRVALPALAGFGAWLHREGVVVDEATLADRDLIERFTQVGMAGCSEATRATRRATLRRIAGRLDPAVAPAPQQIGYRRAKAPYESWQMGRFFELAAAQPTRARRESLTAILALGLGCGLHRQDLAWVRGIDVDTSGRGRSGAVVVKVVGGPRPRAVVVLDEYADLLVARSRRAGEGLLIGGSLLGRVNVTAPTLDRMIGDRSVPRVVPTRLRSTWLVTHLNLRTPYSVLLPAAGLESSRTLDDLLGYADPIPADEAAVLLRGRPR